LRSRDSIAHCKNRTFDPAFPVRVVEAQLTAQALSTSMISAASAPGMYSGPVYDWSEREQVRTHRTRQRQRQASNLMHKPLNETLVRAPCRMYTCNNISTAATATARARACPSRCFCRVLCAVTVLCVGLWGLCCTVIWLCLYLGASFNAEAYYCPLQHLELSHARVHSFSLRQLRGVPAILPRPPSARDTPRGQQRPYGFNMIGGGSLHSSRHGDGGQRGRTAGRRWLDNVANLDSSLDSSSHY
jgi:hypothetical protein